MMQGVYVFEVHSRRRSYFTHHDTFVHIHLFTDDLLKMGHLDAMHLKKGTAKSYLPG